MLGLVRDSKEEACFNGCCPLHPPQPHSSITTAASSRYQFEISMISSINYPNSNSNPNFTNHESLPSLHQSFSSFISHFPQFSLTHQADVIRQTHYSHLSPPNHVCFDYIGHGLFSFSQVSSEIASTSSNPPSNWVSDSLLFDVLYKSVSLSSQLRFGAPETALEKTIQKRIMEFMNVSEDDYSVLLAANLSSAFKIVADCYPFNSHRNVVTVYDYENEAVNLMVETCKKKGAKAMSAEFAWPGMRIQAKKLHKKIESKRKNKRGLFVFPLQSRITGTKYSYSWMKTAKENGWHVLLDASALGTKDMETLGLNLFKPDFLVCSFFKLFGENPSGFACLFVKRSNLEILKDTPISTVNLKPVSELQNHQITHEIEEFEIDQEVTAENGGFEMEFRGLDDADKLGLVVISARTRYLVNWLINALISLEHPHSENGHPAIKIYGPKIKFKRGAAVAFNLFDWKGEKIEPRLVQKLADRKNISLSCGELKNIWIGEDDEERSENGKNGVSVVTVAVGFLTNFEDVYRLWVFVSRFLDADFVEKERWIYTALNQNIIEV